MGEVVFLMMMIKLKVAKAVGQGTVEEPICFVLLSALSIREGPRSEKGDRQSEGRMHRQDQRHRGARRRGGTTRPLRRVLRGCSHQLSCPSTVRNSLRRLRRWCQV